MNTQNFQKFENHKKNVYFSIPYPLPKTPFQSEVTEQKYFITILIYSLYISYLEILDFKIKNMRLHYCS